jgi:hypothetical protein
MKNIVSSIVLAASLLTFSPRGLSQTINWRSFGENQKHLINVNAGLNYGTIIGVGYGYNAEYSFPTGKNLFDDFKTKLGVQVRALALGNFLATVKVHGVFRRYQSDAVTLKNFGGEFAAVFGYYKPKWYAAGEFGFDKAIITHAKHSAYLKESFPELHDGWYIPTGGNFFYGIQLGGSFKNNDLYLKAGRMVAQDFRTSPLLPFYAEIGINHRL